MGKWEDAGYELMTTEQMLKLMEEGHRLSLVPVEVSDEDILSHYGDAEREICFAPEELNEIVEIDYIDDEDVQCILVDDPEHLYLTDGFIPTHNTSNIIFLKSTDDSMIDTLTKMAGKKHVTRKDGKTITQDMEQIITPLEAKVSVNLHTTEEPVISYNDLAFIPDRNSMVFRAGDSPIWNKNELILPMSWRLFQNTIIHPGHKYTLQTIPTMSTAKEFDVRKNIPDFEAMLDKRMNQAMFTEDATAKYQEITGRSDLEMEQLDPDLRAEEIMGMINSAIYMNEKREEEQAQRELEKQGLSGGSDSESYWRRHARQASKDDVPNDDVIQETQKAKAQQEVAEQKRFAGGLLSPSDFYNAQLGTVNRSLEYEVATAFEAAKGGFASDRVNFSFDRKSFSLCSADGTTVYIHPDDTAQDFADDLADASQRKGNRILAEDPKELRDSAKITKPIYIEDAFFKFLAQQRDWNGFAHGKFENQMAKIMKAKLAPS